MFIFNKTIIVCIRFETARIQHYDYIIFEVLCIHLCFVALESAMCSPRSVRYNATEMTAIIIVVVFISSFKSRSRACRVS